MARHLALLVAPLGFVLAVVLAVATLRGYTGQSPVYSMPAVQMGLAHDPHAWRGRTVRLRALVSHTCPFVPQRDTFRCGSRQPALLIDPQALATAPPLLLLEGAPDPILSSLRHLPLVGTLVQRPQLVRWGAPAVYRVRLVTTPLPPAYVALLVDAAPGALDEE